MSFRPFLKLIYCIKTTGYRFFDFSKIDIHSMTIGYRVFDPFIN